MHLPHSEDGELEMLRAKMTYLPHEQNPGSAELNRFNLFLFFFC